MNVNRSVFFFLIFLVFTTGFSFAQKGNFGIQSEGEMPCQFAYYKLKENRSDFKQKALFTNTLLIYGTDLNHYLDRVIMNLLLDEPILKQKVKIYLYRSVEPNIYTTADSILIINIGLLARIQNESELAFILSHELAHLYKNHAYTSDRFSKKEKIQHEDLFNKEHFRSEEDELEADQFGYTHFFLPHGYKTQDIQNVFMCFESDRTFQLNSFHFKDFLLQQSYPFSNTNFIDNSEIDSEDSPELNDFIQQRIEKFNSYKQQNDYENQTDTEFLAYKRIAVDELLRLKVIDHDYLNSIHLSSMLMYQKSDNPFYVTVWLASNYGILKMREKDPDFNWSDDQLNSSFKKEIQYFYTHISLTELKSYVLYLATDLSKKYPDNSYYWSLINSINGFNEHQKYTFPSNNLTIFDPTYQKVNRENETIKNLDDELSEIMESIARKTYCNVFIMKSEHRSLFNTELYNLYGQLRLLKNSVLKYSDTNFVYFPILDNQQQIINRPIYFVHIQYRSVPDRFITRFYYLPLILLNPSSLPFTTAHVFANRARMRVQFVFFDTQTNTINYNIDQTFSDFNGKTILKQFLFDQFVKISNP